MLHYPPAAAISAAKRKSSKGEQCKRRVLKGLYRRRGCQVSSPPIPFRRSSSSSSPLSRRKRAISVDQPSSSSSSSALPPPIRVTVVSTSTLSKHCLLFHAIQRRNMCVYHDNRSQRVFGCVHKSLLAPRP